jgi:hypothetical protein
VTRQRRQRTSRPSIRRIASGCDRVGQRFNRGNNSSALSRSTARNCAGVKPA